MICNAEIINIVLDDILYEIRCWDGYQVYDNGDMIKFTAPNWQENYYTGEKSGCGKNMNIM